MNIVNKRGEKTHIDDSVLSEEMTQWLYQSVQMYPDDAELEPIWEVVVTKKHISIGEQDSVVDVQTFNHKPTKEELIYLLAKNDCYRFGYLTVTKGYQMHEDID